MDGQWLPSAAPARPPCLQTSFAVTAPCLLTAFLLCLPLIAQSSFKTVNSSSTLTTYELTRKCAPPSAGGAVTAGQAGASANWPLSGPSEKQPGLMALVSGIPPLQRCFSTHQNHRRDRKVHFQKQKLGRHLTAGL